MSESQCPRCGSVVVRDVRLSGIVVPGTAAEQVIFLVRCRACVWQQEECVA